MVFPREAQVLHAARNGHISISQQRALLPSQVYRKDAKGGFAVSANGDEPAESASVDSRKPPSHAHIEHTIHLRSVL